MSSAPTALASTKSPDRSFFAATGRLDSLTALRAFAALAIFIYHCHRDIPSLLAAQWVLGLGYIGVTFFFVLSGFILTWTFRDGIPRTTFYWRRFSRIWPVAALGTVTAALLMFMVGAQQNWLHFGVDLLGVQSLTPWRYSYDAPLWSVSCEFFFYAMFPLLIFVAYKLRDHLLALTITIASGMALIIGIVLAVIPSAQWDLMLYTNPLFRIGEFAVGILLAIAIRNGWRPRISTKGATIFAIATFAVLTVVGDLLYPGNLMAFPLGVADFVMMIPFAAVIGAFAIRDIDNTDPSGTKQSYLLTSRPLLIAGAASFSFYVFHEMVIDQLTHWIDPTSIGLGILVAALSLVLASAVGYAIYRYYETPIEAKLRRFPVGKDSKPITLRPPKHLKNTGKPAYDIVA